jgi:hypothetical protein
VPVAVQTTLNLLQARRGFVEVSLCFVASKLCPHLLLTCALVQPSTNHAMFWIARWPTTFTRFPVGFPKVGHTTII